MHLRDPRRAPVPPDRDHSLDIKAGGGGWVGGSSSLPSLDGFTVPSTATGDVGGWIFFAVLAWCGYRLARVFLDRDRRNG